MKQFFNFAALRGTSLINLSFFLFLILPLVSKGQEIPTLLKVDNEFIQSRLEKSVPAGWLYMKNSSKLREGEIFTTYKTNAGLGVDDYMALVKTTQDEQGYIHNEYQQYYKDIKVEGGEMFEHLQDCYVILLNGHIVEQLNLISTPELDVRQAVTAAIGSIKAEKYAWEDPLLEQEIKEDLENPTATYYPSGQLVITRLNGQANTTENYRLAWTFVIKSISPFQIRKIYVDALNGEILKSFDTRLDNGPCVTLYDGIQTLDTKWVGGLFHGHHHMETDDINRKIKTKNGSSIEHSWGHTNHLFDSDDSWAADRMRESGAHWAVSRTWDFFKSTYGRNGMDNSNNEVRIFSTSLPTNNAGWVQDGGKDYIEFGDGDGSFGTLTIGSNYATLDAAGHEYTHGVTAREANLAYEGESGALNESFSDIFGVLVEGFARGGSFNWTILEDAGVVLRDMQNPALGFIPQPATYLTDASWVNVVGCIPTDADGNTNNDFCGVHTNSGVQNRWFFLLTSGGFQNGVSVQGIGSSKSALISYNNLCYQLGSGADHPAAREGAIAAARLLYGACSNEVIQTTNAWAAVGVGSVFEGPCLVLSGDPSICFDLPGTHEYEVSGLPGTTFTWEYPSAWTGYTSGIGNNKLTITHINTPPLGPYPTSTTISVKSSSGERRFFEVELDECRHPRCEKSSERSVKKEQSTAIKLQEVNLYPNPTNDKLILSANGNIYGCTIFDVTGSKIKSITYIDGLDNVMIDVANLKIGTYFISIQLESSTVSKRFIKID
jgi:bacillolysin